MSVKKLTFALLFLLIAVLAACGPTAAEPGAGDPAGTPLPQETPVVETPETGNDSDAIAAATAFLAGELGVAEDDIEVISTEQTEFTDSCLGLGQANESCLQAITPGWLILLEIDGQPLEWDGIGVMALNMQKVGVGPFSYGQNIALDDGIIDVAIARLRNWRDLWLLFKGFFRGNFQEPEVMTHLPMRQKLVIDAKTPLDVQADGDLLGKTPVTVYLKPGALQVFVPADA